MPSKSPPTLDNTESTKLLDTLLKDTGTSKKKQKAIRNYCMACLMLDAGLRVGELVSLRYSDLFFNNLPVRTIFIKPYQTKNKVEHSVPVATRLDAALRSYFSAWFLCDIASPGAFAFYSGREDLPLTTRQVERIICAAGMKALGRPVHPHVLRHTVASKWMRVTSSSTVQQLLGHKYLSSTQIYCHPNSEDRRRAVALASDLPPNLPPAEPLFSDQPAASQETSQDSHSASGPVSQDQSQPAQHQAPTPASGPLSKADQS